MNIDSDPFLRTALALWEQVSSDGRLPSQVSTLKLPHKKSGVYRLEGAGPHGAAVIAKRARRSTIEVERLVYQEVLSVLPVHSLRLYGSADDEDPGYGWLFLEDAGDRKWSAESPEHRHLATRWIAQIHLGAEILVDKVPLPRPGIVYYRDLARYAKQTLLASVSNPALPEQSRKLLEQVAEDCSAFESHWSVVERVLTRLPTTLTLTDFSSNNTRVRPLGSALELLVYDFERAFFGPPAMELRYLDIAEYWRMAGKAWGVEIDHVVLLAIVGGALFGLRSIPGEAESLSSSWPERSVRRIRYYSARIGQALDTLNRAGSGSVDHG